MVRSVTSMYIAMQAQCYYEGLSWRPSQGPPRPAISLRSGRETHARG